MVIPLGLMLGVMESDSSNDDVLTSEEFDLDSS